MIVRIGVVLLLLTATFGNAHADVFAFKDQVGYEKCLQTDHLVETVKTDKGEQSRLLSPLEIQLRCVESAVKLLSPSKDRALVVKFIKLTKRMTAPVNSLDLIGILVARWPRTCNDIAIYEVINRSLSHPRDSHPRSFFTRSRAIVKRCLRDPQYRKDFLEEKDNSNPTLRANACEILREEKLVKSCPKKAK